jgi:hypothetical protein
VLEKKDGTGAYVPYVGTDITLGSSKVLIASSDKLLDQQIFEMRLSVASGASSDYLTFAVKWLDPCIGKFVTKASF